MKIKRRKIDGSLERRIMTGAIVSSRFLKEAFSFYDPELIEQSYMRTILEWCFQHWKKYEKAPNKSIKDIFEARASKLQEGDKDLIADLLSALSEDYERSENLNVPYLLDQAEEWFKTQSLAQLYRDGKALVAQGDVEQAEGLLGSYKRVGRPETLGENPFRNAETIMSAFEHEETPLVTFPGALGRMLNDELCRDKLFAVLGPEKRGKSFWLNEIAFRASLARRNVALFQIGDMSKEQVIVRLGVRLTGRSNRKRYCEEHPSPVPDCLLNQLGTCERRKRSRSSIIEKRGVKTIHEAYESGVEHEPCTKCSKEFDFRGSFWYESIPDVKTLTWRETFKAGQKFLSRIRGRDFRLSAHASDQLSVSGLKLILDNWESFDGFVPDVIVIDYADNLAPESEDARKDVRHQENHKWKMLRGLSLERHCLVATATQAASRGYGKVSLEMDDYSEDKRKHGHVTAEIGLNQTLDEKRAKLMRINFIVQREGEFFSEDSVVVGMDLGRGRPVLFSYRG